MSISFIDGIFTYDQLITILHLENIEILSKTNDSNDLKTIKSLCFDCRSACVTLMYVAHANIKLGDECGGGGGNGENSTLSTFERSPI